MEDSTRRQLQLHSPEQKLVFSSPEHQTTLQKNLHRQWMKGQNCDLLFHVGSVDIPVHSCVVACFSTKISYHLQKAELAHTLPAEQEQYSATEDGMHFSFYKTGEKKVGVDVSRDIVEALIGFMYTGSLSISCCQTLLLLETAQLLGLSIVIQIVEVFIRRNPDVAKWQLGSTVCGDSEETLQMGPGTADEALSGRQASASEETVADDGEGETEKADVLKPSGMTHIKASRANRESREEALCLDPLQLDIKQEMVDTDLQAFLDSAPQQGRKQETSAASSQSQVSETDTGRERKQDAVRQQNDEGTLMVMIKQEVLEDVPLHFEEAVQQTDTQQPLHTSTASRDSGSEHLAHHSSTDRNESDNTYDQGGSEICDSSVGVVVKTARKNGSFNCADCGKSYVSSVRLREHVFKVHEQKKFMQKTCPHCDRRFQEKEKLKVHCREVHGDFVCEVQGCDFRTMHRRTSRIHQTTAHGQRSYPCLKCDYQSSTKKGLKEHRTSSHAQFSCSFCKKSFLQKENLTLHLRAVHKTNTFQCQQCEDSFSSESALLLHCQQFHVVENSTVYGHDMEVSQGGVNSSETFHHNNSTADAENQVQMQEPQLDMLLAVVQSAQDAVLPQALVTRRSRRRYSRWNCRICGKKQDSKEALFEHLSDEHKGDIFCCQQCPQKYLRKEALTRHVREQHQGRCYKCTSCGELFTVSTQFAAHCKTQHKIQKPFQCQEPSCSFKSSTIKSLECHKKFVHAKERNEVCYKCGSCFPTQLYLHNHQRSCLQLEQHLCSICGAVFSLRQSLMSHINNKHGGERRYSCVQCGQRFSCHANRNRHMRIHNNTFPYMCDICGQKFRHSNSLKDHVRRKHGDM